MQDVAIPAGVHVQELSAVSPITGGRITYTIVWADRHYSTCRHCGQYIGHEVPTCPAVLNPGAGDPHGRLESVDQACGNCGHWCAVPWCPVGDVQASVNAAAMNRARRVETERRRIAAILAADIEAARARIDAADPDDRDDVIAAVCRGSDSTPDVCWEDGELSAWAEGPVGDDPVIVRSFVKH